MILKGQVIVLTSGVYDSFNVQNVVVAQDHFDMSQAIIDYRDEHVGQDRRVTRYGMSFAEYLDSRGFVEFCETIEINIGQYDEFEPDYHDR